MAVPSQKRSDDAGKPREPAGRLDGSQALPKPPRPREAGYLPFDSSQPTADATERLIFESLANPLHRRMSIDERCEVLGLGRSTWYRHTAEPLFRARAQAVYHELCQDEILPVILTLIESAKELGKEGHGDRKLFLGLTGIYNDRDAGKASKDDEQAKPATTMTDAELLAHFADRPHLLPPGVQRRLGIAPESASIQTVTPPPLPPAKPAKAVK